MSRLAVRPREITALTCCRALFAAWVFAYHVDLQSQYAQALGPVAVLVHAGSLGVDGFFILSGIVLAYAHPTLVPAWPEVRAFLGKRLLRIYPVHLATIALFAALLVGALIAGTHPREPERFGLDELWHHLLLLHAWGASDRWAWNYPSWSISAEWAGYLMFPVLWPALRRAGFPVLAGITLLAAAAIVLVQSLARQRGLSLTFDGGLLRFFPEFIGGMSLVALLRAGAPSLPGPSLTAGGVAAMTAGLCGGWTAVVILGLWAVLAGLLVGAMQGRASLLARVPGLRWFGGVSYSFYMSFALVETVQASIWRGLAAGPAAHPLLYGVSTTGLTLGLGTALWAFVETPAMRLYRWRLPAPAPGLSS